MNAIKPTENVMKEVFQVRKKIGKYKILSEKIKKILNEFYLLVL